MYIFFFTKAGSQPPGDNRNKRNDLCFVNKLLSREGNCQVAGLVIDQNNNIQTHTHTAVQEDRTDKSTELIIASTQTITICPFICEISLCSERPPHGAPTVLPV